MARTILITGGAGFIGCNAARAYIERGDRVLVFDDLSRPGSERNRGWLETIGRYECVRGDVREAEHVRRVFDSQGIDVVLHLAAQVAVTKSIGAPWYDFEVNARGTLNLLEAIRLSGQNPIALYASTNKVYGAMAEVAVVERDGRYAYRDLPRGVPESWPLDFHSPYGCSKGAGDQYFLDYARIYGLRTVVFRQSCIYGSRQFGVEDQGWVAWFAIAAAMGRPVTVYGDGKQVRDVLFVEDLITAFDAAIERIDAVCGRAFNIGGGWKNQISVLELLGRLETRFGEAIRREFAPWRPGDQRVFVSDISRAGLELGWSPRVSVEEGVERLCRWVVDNRPLFE